jgi:hypothetical protein
LRVSSVSKLPNIPAVYVLYGGKDPVYVGVSDKLRNRVEQHLVKRDSSIAAQTSAVCLNPDYVTEVRWWEHTLFASRDQLEAAELVAYGFFEPVLRSRGAPSKRAIEVSSEEEFQEEMRQLFRGDASGQLVILSLQDALNRIEKLEERVKALEKRR